MSGCAIRRWGTGSGYSRPQNTEATREAEKRLGAMKAERARQDAALWGSAEPTKPAPSIEKPNAGNM